MTSADDAGWPDPSDATESLELFKARLEVRKKRVDDEIGRAKAEREAEVKVKEEFYKGLFEVAKGSIDRGRASAEKLQAAATAIGTIYTGVLALTFSVTDNPLPSRGLIPAMFLGLAIALSTAYLAYISKPSDVAGPRATGSLRGMELERARVFILWTRAPSLARAYWLRAAVVALGAAVAFLPAPWIAVSSVEVEEASATAVPDWPGPPPSGPPLELRKIRYTAEIAEATELRELARGAEAENRRDDERGWWTAAVIALAIVFLAPLAIRGLVSKAEDEVPPPDGLPGPTRAT